MTMHSNSSFCQLCLRRQNKHAIENNIEREITTFYANLTVMMRMNACLFMREAEKRKKCSI